MKRIHHSRTDTGFTLIELLVVISIIALLSSIVLASLDNARTKSTFAAAELFADNTYHAYGANAAGYWNFNEASGAALDSSGNGNNSIGGTFPRDSVNTYNGTGKSIVLNGTNQYVQINDSPSLDTTQGTIAAWIKTTAPATNAYSPIITKTSGTKTQFWMGVYSVTGQLAVDDAGGVGPGVTNIPGPALNDNQWHYVAFTFKSGVVDGSQAYIDGAAAGSPFTYTLESLSGGTLYIGVSAMSPAMYYTGNIDDTAVYTNTLTLNEIKDLYAEGLPAHLAMQ